MHNVIRKTFCGGGLPYWCVAFWGLFRDWTRKRQKRRRERKMPTSFNDSLPLLTGICMLLTSIRQRERMEQPARGRPCLRSRPTNSTTDQAGTHACVSYQTRKGQHITPSSSTPGAPPALRPGSSRVTRPPFPHAIVSRHLSGDVCDLSLFI